MIDVMNDNFLSDITVSRTKLKSVIADCDDKELAKIFPGVEWSLGGCFRGIHIPVDRRYLSFRIEVDTDAAHSLSFSKIIFGGLVHGDNARQDLKNYATCSQSSHYRHLKTPFNAMAVDVYETGMHTEKEEGAYWQASFPDAVKVSDIILYSRIDTSAKQNKFYRVVGLDESGNRHVLYRTTGVVETKEKLIKRIEDALDSIVALRPLIELEHQQKFDEQVASSLIELTEIVSGSDSGASPVSICQNLLNALLMMPNKTEDFGVNSGDAYEIRLPKTTSARYLKITAYGAAPTSLGRVQLVSKDSGDKPIVEFKGKSTQFKYKRVGWVRPEYFSLGLHTKVSSRVYDLEDQLDFDQIRIWNINRHQIANTLFLEFAVSDDRKNWTVVHDKGVEFKQVFDVMSLIDAMMPTKWLPDYARLFGKIITQFRRRNMVNALARHTRKDDVLRKAVFSGSDEIFNTKQFAPPLKMAKHGLRVPLRFRNQEFIMKELVKVRDDIRALGHLPLFMYGTLLGAIREGDFIPHDDDLDLAIILERVNPKELPARADQFLEELRSTGMKVTRGPKGVPLLHCQRPPLTIDIFLLSHFEGKMYWPHKHLSLKAEDPEIFLPVGEIEFKGETFDAPKDPEAVSEARYGADWRVPNDAFEW